MLLNSSHVLTQDRCIPSVRKINELLFKWSVDCFENEAAKVPCIYFIIYCYCAEVAIKSAGIHSPHVCDRQALCVDREHLCPIRNLPREHGRGIHSRDCVLFTLLLKQKYQPVFPMLDQLWWPSSCRKEKEVSSFFLTYPILRTKIYESSSLSKQYLY